MQLSSVSEGQFVIAGGFRLPMQPSQLVWLFLSVDEGARAGGVDKHMLFAEGCTM